MLPTITVVGNLKRLETRHLSTGKQLTKFQIECSEKGKDDKWTNLYLSGECWEQQAKFVEQYFKDGSPAIVTGKLFTNVYEKQDGTKVYENKLLFPSVSFVPKDKSEQSTYDPQQNVANNQKPYQAPTQEQMIPDIDLDSEIPF